MARARSKSITVTYGGSIIYDGSSPAQSLAERFTLSRNYTTTAEPIVDADVPVLRAYGNASGSFPLTVHIDYGSEEDAFSAMMAWAAFADENQTGVLTVSVGALPDDIVVRWDAGLEGLEIRTALFGSSVRLSLAFSFILGRKI